jgi:MYXO-CTERM domain-containing protein
VFVFSLSALASPAPVHPLVLAGPHARQVAQYGGQPYTPGVPARRVLPVPTPGPDLTVYGYLAYWQDDLGSVPWDDVTHLAIFSAGANSDGSLFDTSKWDIADDAVVMAEPYGVRVHLCVTNFTPSSLETLLSSAANRARLIDELVAWKAETGAHGVNIDFEGLPASVRTEMVTFTRDLEAAVGEVVLAGPSVDWSGAWDYSELTRNADIFVMGYGYHWSGSDWAGPTDPLRAGAGTVWEGVQSYSLAWTVDDYLANGADPRRVILGLPLYGMAWPTSSNGVPAATDGGGSSVVFSEAWDDEARYGRNWEADSATPYTRGDGRQIWYGDTDSVRERIAYTRDEAGVQGIGFWALHYDGDDGDFWQMVRTETARTGTGTPPDTDTTDTGTPPDPVGGTNEPDEEGAPGFVADAGRPFLAYVGDTVVLSGVGSYGPDDVEVLQYEWVQMAGPAVVLSSDTDAEPTFTVADVGTHVFELVVGDGTRRSSAARSYVVVIDPAGPPRNTSGCGCTSARQGLAALPALLAGLAGLAARRRRRAAGLAARRPDRHGRHAGV